MSEVHTRNLVEAALLAAGRSLTVQELLTVFDALDRPTPEALRQALAELATHYEGRGIEIRETASGFRIQVRRELAAEVSRLWPERPVKYSRALLETLALIAYRQPLTRAEIEAVRGVAVNPNIIRTLLERGWIRVVGHRDLPGHPELLGTTREFLDYFGLKSIGQLPPLAEVKALSELDPQLSLPEPLGEHEVAEIPVGTTPVPLLAAPDATAESMAEAAAEAAAEPAVEPELDSEAEPAPAVVAGEGT